METFELTITEEEKTWCKKLIFWTIAQHLGQNPGPKPALDSATLQLELGAFVTLKKNGQLRGCIGNVTGQGPLAETIERMACAAAFEDPRFPPLTAHELDALQIEVSVMGPLTLCPDPERIEVGKHGLYIRKAMHAGLLLPQVALEWGWDRETFLDQTCVKAGLPRGSWRKPKTEIWWFEAVIF
ncbi:MAG: AmmeMemoRadiSam system protein A [Desulfovibrionales bacterium]|nr:AmmeMemoRadiSam system protein A [Desulfovibrionales bacterium]